LKCYMRERAARRMPINTHHHCMTVAALPVQSSASLYFV
jgi:hypothetical protein